MPALIRNTAPRGPRFYRGETDDGPKVMFVNILDASTQDGPREAREEDRQAHPEAFTRFAEEAEDDFPGAKPLVTFEGDEPAQVGAERAANAASREGRRRASAEA